jgi:hypothetical protein
MAQWLGTLPRSVGRRLRRVAVAVASPGELSWLEYARREVLPRAPDEPDVQPFVPLGRLGCRGLALDAEEQRARLKRWASEPYPGLFAALGSDPTINTQGPGPTVIHNGFYPTPDAEIYAAMILDARPARIVEVGSGFSSLIARAAIRHCGLDTELIVIDPTPRTDVRGAVDRLILKPVEESGLDGFSWGDRDILFIDSSHVCRTRGDLPYLFCRVLPALPAGMTVHVHDIFLPYDYPNNYDLRCYNEQYLLFCLLNESARYRTLLATHWLSREHGEAMRAVFGEAVGRDPLYFGASYWFRIERPPAP